MNNKAVLELEIVMTPEEFKVKMEELLDNSTKEYAHIYMDELMCNLLISLGYSDGVAIFNKQEKYYV